MLFDPDANAPVYAASVAYEPTVRGADASWRGALQGSKIMLPPMPPEAWRAFATALETLGASVLKVPSEEVPLMLERGGADSAVISISRPSEIIEVLGRY